MKVTLLLKAQLSSVSYTTRKSFQKQLDRSPYTAFQYFFQLEVQKLHNVSKYDDITSYVRGNSNFKRFTRNEWDNMSLTKKRLYYASFCQSMNIDIWSVSKIELAKRLEIPIPAMSEYLFFRNKFKLKFDSHWSSLEHNNYRNPSRPSTMRKNGAAETYPRNRTITSVSKIKPRKRLVAMKRISRSEDFTNDHSHEAQKHFDDYMKRFQQMCKECRYAWNEKVGCDQKLEIRKKLHLCRSKFEEMMDNEIQVLQKNMEIMSKFGHRSETYLRTSDENTSISPYNILPMAYPSKKK
ncbi:YOR114W [Saccharomyces arboricola H-6]|uniref:YOR114W n=1 Tax=Saccharomyces arboricola (strain H-6 / AS 2.3317 / CBS 10644) TaxID=1160507 RepID=J8LI48_SACAR|nr:YOR114W [Saccharomyces arboricola H-6]